MVERSAGFLLWAAIVAGWSLDMRRVVVTGLGMVTPLGCGVEPTWKRILAGESGARKIDTFDVSDLPARSPAWFRAATAPTAPSIPTSGWSRRTSARSTTSSSSRMCAAEPGARRCQLASRDRRGPLRHRHHDRLRHRRPLRHRRHRDPAEGARPAQGIAVLHPRPPDQSRLGLRLDRARPEGPQPCGGHGLFDRRACDRRCRRG